MDISTLAKNAIRTAYGSEQAGLDDLAKKAKEGDIHALKLLLSYAYGTPAKQQTFEITDNRRSQKNYLDQFREDE